MSDEVAEQDRNPVPLLPIRTGSTWIALPALEVVEVLDQGEPIPLPRAPAHIAGLLNLRGTALPVVDLARFLGLADAAEEGDGAGFPRIAVVRAREMTVGLWARAVRGVVPAGTHPVRPPGGHGGLLAELATGEVDLGGTVAVLVDLGALLERARVRG